MPDETPDTPLAPIATALGLNDTATQTEILSALAMRAAPDPAPPDPARFIPIEAVSRPAGRPQQHRGHPVAGPRPGAR